MHLWVCSFWFFLYSLIWDTVYLCKRLRDKHAIFPWQLSIILQYKIHATMVPIYRRLKVMALCLQYISCMKTVTLYAEFQVLIFKDFKPSSPSINFMAVSHQIIWQLICFVLWVSRWFYKQSAILAFFILFWF